MGVIITFVVIFACIVIMFIKDINPRLKSIAKKILIIMSIFIAFFMFLSYQRIMHGRKGRAIEVPADTQK